MKSGEGLGDQVGGWVDFFLLPIGFFGYPDVPGIFD